ncbi:MAG TPA: hypothetical protein VNS34_06530 [Rhizobiaceae bacterium]|nr:hypothetical protein [Rhizobiaceae bacterium]
MTDLRALVGAGAIVLLSLSPSFALGELLPPGSGNPGSPPQSHSAPGPVVGVGLPAMIAVGGYMWFRYRSRQKKK